MSDAFDRLRAPDRPIDPDPAFAAGLRARLARALVLPKGVTVSELTVDRPVPAPSSSAASTAVAGHAVLTPYLAVSGAEEAIAWYGEALGARLVGDPIVMPDGRIGHAELDIAGAPIMLSEEHPEIGVTAPVPGSGATFTLHLAVGSVDEVISHCTAAGATLERPAADYDYGRNGVIRDPFGHRWMISSEPDQPGLRQGDIGYVSLWVPDVSRAATFFASVLGWRYEDDGRTEGRRVVGHHLHHGMWGGVPEPTLFCCFAVDAVESAVERIRAAGGTASEPQDEPYGRLAEATDPLGTQFAVFTPPGGAAVGPPPGGGTAEGDLVYVTMEVTNSDVARDFYATVLGWHVSPGHVADGWSVDGVSPMVGIAGGRPAVRCLPMYKVDDVHAAVARVRAAGGAASEPEEQPYGITAEATDDQGTRFYLGQL